MIVKEAVKLLIDHGYQKVNHVGSHVKYSKVGYPNVTLTQHGPPKERLHPKMLKEIQNAIKLK